MSAENVASPVTAFLRSVESRHRALGDISANVSNTPPRAPARKATAATTPNASKNGKISTPKKKGTPRRTPSRRASLGLVEKAIASVERTIGGAEIASPATTTATTADVDRDHGHDGDGDDCGSTAASMTAPTTTAAAAAVAAAAAAGDVDVESLPKYIQSLSAALRSSNESLEVCHRALTEVKTDEDKLQKAFRRHVATIGAARRREAATLRSRIHRTRKSSEEAVAKARAEARESVRAANERAARAEALLGDARERYLTLEKDWRDSCAKLAQREARLAVTGRSHEATAEKLKGVEGEARVLSSRVRDLEAEAESLRDKVAAQANLAAARAHEVAGQIGAAEDAAAEARERAEALEAARAEAAERAEALEAELAAARARASAAEKESAERYAASAELKVRLETERHERIEATARVQAFHTSLVEIQRQQAEDKNAFESALDTARLDAKNGKGQRDQALTAVGLSSRVIEDLREKLMRLGARAADAEAALAAERERVGALQTQLNDAVSGGEEAARLRAEVAALEARAAAQAEERDAAVERADNLAQERAALEARLDEELQRWTALLHEEMTRATEALEEEKETSRVLRSRVEDLSAESRGVEERCEARVRELEAKCAALDEQATTCAAEVIATECELAKASEDLDAARKLVNEQVAAIEKASRAKSMLTRAVDAEKARASEAADRSVSLEKENAGLRSELRAREMELANKSAVAALAQGGGAGASADANQEQQQQQQQQQQGAAESDEVRAGKAAAVLCGRLRPLLESAAKSERDAGSAIVSEDGPALKALSEAARLIDAAIHARGESVCFLREALQIERAERRRVYNRLVELTGNIRVVARVRPVLSAETVDGAEDGDRRAIVSLPSGDDETVIVDGAGPAGRDKVFRFDGVVAGEQATQADAYARVAPLVTSALDGFNVCVMAYGQTGSGKTHTMRGSEANPGVLPRAVETLFSALRADASRTWSVSMSMIEIYNNDVYDLLSRGQPKRDVHEGPEGTVIAGVQAEPIDAEARAMQLFTRGDSNRAEGATLMNEHSSRSHSIVILNVSVDDPVAGTSRTSRLTFVDLAGSESVSKSGASGETLQEAKCINRSLSALGDVLAALSEGRSHVPYRNSRLTTILRDSLGGDAKMLLFVCVAPNAYHAVETRQALSFGLRARQTERIAPGNDDAATGSSGSSAAVPPRTPQRGNNSARRSSTGGSRGGKPRWNN